MKQNKSKQTPKTGRFAWERFLPFYLIGAGVIGMLASLSLALEKLALLENPDRTPLCDINPILSCGSVMDSAQASLFGVPHSFLGIAAFSALMMLGIALVAGATFNQWLWKLVVGASALGVLVIQYLVYESLYQIGALCPWCIVIWLVTIPIFFGVAAYTVRTKVLDYKHPQVSKVMSFFERYNTTILAIWFIIVVYLIVVQFWYYWSTLL